MSEKIDLTTPITVPTITSYQITRLTLDIEGAGVIVNLKSNTGERTQCSYNGLEATILMVAMNKMNFTTSNSMQKKVLQKLIADGKLAGTISGSPD